MSRDARPRVPRSASGSGSGYDYSNIRAQQTHAPAVSPPRLFHTFGPTEPPPSPSFGVLLFRGPAAGGFSASSLAVTEHVSAFAPSRPLRSGFRGAPKSLESLPWPTPTLLLSWASIYKPETDKKFLCLESLQPRAPYPRSSAEPLPFAQGEAKDPFRNRGKKGEGGRTTPKRNWVERRALAVLLPRRPRLAPGLRRVPSATTAGREGVRAQATQRRAPSRSEEGLTLRCEGVRDPDALANSLNLDVVYSCGPPL